MDYVRFGRTGLQAIAATRQVHALEYRNSAAIALRLAGSTQLIRK